MTNSINKLKQIKEFAQINKMNLKYYELPYPHEKQRLYVYFVKIQYIPLHKNSKNLFIVQLPVIDCWT